MFEIFSKKRIKRIVADVEDYYNKIREIEREERKKETWKKENREGSKINQNPSNSGVRYSLKDPEKKTEVRFSLGEPNDGYDQMKVDSFLKSVVRTQVPLKSTEVLDRCVDKSFVDQLWRLIDQKGMKAADVYKAAQIDRRLFSKITSEGNYKPSKDTCLALCYAMQLTLREAQDLLSRAGYTISHSSKRDVVLEFFFRERLYDLNDINRVLYTLNEKTIGR